jgi:putative endopeptidase
MPNHKKTQRHNHNRNNKTHKLTTNKVLNDFTLKHFQPITDVICSKHPYQSFEVDFQKIHPELLKKNKRTIERDLINMLHKKYVPSPISPSNDFYTYINYTWLRDKTLGSTRSNNKATYYVEVDNFRIMQDKVYHQVIELVKNYIKNHDTHQAKQLSNVYKSFLSLSPSTAKKHISETHKMIDGYRTSGNLLDFLAHINKNMIVSWGSPIHWKVQPDEMNSKIFRSYICMPELSLYDYLLYLGDYGQTAKYIEYKNKIKREYFKTITKIFDSCYGHGHGLSAQDVFDVELELLTAMGCDKVKNDSSNYYNVVKADEALEKYGFDFKEFSKLLGYKKVPDFFICESLNYLKCVCKLLKDNWNSPKWVSYWHHIYLRQIIRFDKKLINLYYEFHGKFINGQPLPFPRDIYPIFGLSVTFNTFLTNQYVDNYSDTRTMAFAESLGTDLLTIFKRIIKQNTWLSTQTKKYALQKLEHLKFIIGHPSDLRPDPILTYDSDDAWGNLVKIATWKMDAFIELTDKAVVNIPAIDWNNFKLIGKQCYIVNAFYTPVENSIYIPLAYLQKPFVDLDQRGIEYNLALLGDTLSHEMSHSLDNTGSKYDWHGNLHDWWTPEDKKKFKNIIKDIVLQYETFAKRDGIKFDAQIGVGEDMADISGISICEEYLRDFQSKNDDVIPIRAASFQAFYTYYAISQKQFINKKAIASQLKVNPHPLDKYRTNIPLSRLEVFRSIYNVKKGDDMWWHSTSTIW